MRKSLRWAVVAFALCAAAPAQEPDQATLRRLAEQLGTGTGMQLPSNIDPALMKLAAEYLKQNPDIVKDPKFQQQVQQMRERAQRDPSGFAKQLKEQNTSLTPQQIENFKQQMQQPTPTPTPTPGNPPTPPNFPQPPKPGDPPPQPGQPPPAYAGMSGPPNPSGKPEPTPEQKAANKEGYQQMVGMWENSFGDIDSTPALKQSLVEMFSGDGKSPFDGDGNGNGFGNNGTNGNSSLNGGSGSGSQSGFVNWLKTATSSGPPSWWKNMTNGSGNNNNSPPPQFNNPNFSGSAGGSGFGGGSADFGGLGSMGVMLAVLVLLAVVGFIAWRYWPQIQQVMGKKPRPVGGLGEWTIDPREVVDRDTLVKAFDYLSVLICGDGARVWNHQTIADAFRENVPGAAPFANPLARLYALARYSPANETISPADIAEARGYLCRLAGVQG